MKYSEMNENLLMTIKSMYVQCNAIYVRIFDLPLGARCSVTIRGTKECDWDMWDKTPAMVRVDITYERNNKSKTVMQPAQPLYLYYDTKLIQERILDPVYEKAGMVENG